MTVATKDDFQDLTAEETTTYFIQSNISSGEELKSYNGLLEGKEYYIYRSDPLQSSVDVETKFKIFDWLTFY